MVKVFLYLSNVDESAGPFMYLGYSHAGGKWRRLFPQHPPRGTLPMPANDDELIPKEDRLVATGRAGTIIFCDTSGLHRGGLAEGKQRIMYTSVYTSSASPSPIRYTYPLGFSTKALALPIRFALENDSLQHEPKYY